MLANRLVQKIMSAIPDVVMNGDPTQRYHGTHTTSTKTAVTRHEDGVYLLKLRLSLQLSNMSSFCCFSVS